jgi:serine/threonine protein kinase
MTDNPYSYLGKPIHRFQHFYGRKHELAKVADDVRNGQCISVIGIRRIGKTSLLFQLLDPDARSAYQLADDTLCVYVDCGRLATTPPGEVYAEIMRLVCRQFGKCRQADLLESPGETLSYRGFEENILELRDAGLSLVLLLDEFERLGSNPHLDVSFFVGLRALHIEHELTYVTASRRPIMELAFSHQDVISSPFPNVFDSVRVGLFPESEARELIRAGGVFSPEVEDFLLDLTGGHPLALQHACHYAFERQEKTGSALTADDRVIVWIQTQEAMEEHYRYYWGHLSGDHKRILAAPTHFAAQVKDNITVENLFKDLIAQGLLTMRLPGSYGYAGRALAEYVRHAMTRDKSLGILSTNDLVGQRLGQYQIVARLGRGGMADVYKAHQLSLDRDVAIKVMLPHIAADAGFSARFQREARAVAGLRHPHIVQIHDFGQENGIYYMVMEYISDENLKTHLQAVKAQGEQMPVPDIMRIVMQIGEALHYAHGQGLVHRDVKPSNVMLTPVGEAVLTDFGLAKIVAGTKFNSSSLVGTPAYMAPEQINESTTVDRRADVYALGVVLYEMATGQVPFDADTPVAVIFKHLQEPLPDPRHLRPDLPNFIVRIIEKALAKEPEQRYQTVQEMLDALQRGEVTFITPRQCWGVLVGVDHYLDPAISLLTVCADDVSLTCNALCATSGYERARLRLLAEDQDALPTKSEILANMQAVAQSAAEGDLLLFYFSGHGVAEGDEGYLLPCDARYGVLADTSIPIRRVTELMLQSQARAKVLVLDACHSGAQIGKAPLTMTPEFIQHVFDEAEGIAVLASCTQGQVSWPWPEEHCSVFTYYLLEGISGAADREGKGFITVNDLARHVTNGVKLWAVQRGYLQTPTTQAQVVGDIILVDRRPKREEWTLLQEVPL